MIYLNNNAYGAYKYDSTNDTMMPCFMQFHGEYLNPRSLRFKTNQNTIHYILYLSNLSYGSNYIDSNNLATPSNWTYMNAGIYLTDGTYDTRNYYMHLFGSNTQSGEYSNLPSNLDADKYIVPTTGYNTKMGTNYKFDVPLVRIREKNHQSRTIFSI